MMPVIYYGLYCEPGLQRVYWILVSFCLHPKTTVYLVEKISSLGVVCSIFTFTPTFQSPFVRPLRASLFGGFALSTLTPVIHGIVLHGWDQQDYRVSLNYLLGTLAFNTAGAVAYAAKVCRPMPL